jgi:BolA family transcriptional regulator, general stress-responsive regulator
MMMTTEQTLRTALENALHPTALNIVNESHLHAGHREAGQGGDTHFRIIISSDALIGLSKVAQHRLIYQAVGALMPHPIHALAVEVV